MSDAPRDQNFVPTALGESSTTPGLTLPFLIDEITGRLLVDLSSGAGTVTSVSVVPTNGFAGTVANATTTPAITLTTSITGILQGNGTAVSAITVGSGLSFAGGTLSATATGDVTKVGTPVNNQIGVWTGDGTIEGDVDFVFDTSADTLTLGAVSGVGRLVAHAVVGDASDGLLVEANNGTDVGILGVGNTANVTWYGAHNFAGSISPSTNDGASLGSSSNQWSDVFVAEGGVINWDNSDVTITQTNSVLAFAGASYTFDGNITPASNDGAALGSATSQFSDLFLAEGGVINFDNGDITLTQANNLLSLAGGEFSFGANTAGFDVTDNGNSGTSDTIDWKLGNKQKSTFTGNCTFTFTAPTKPCSLILECVQDGTARTITWPSTVKWSGGTAPTFTGTSGRSDIVTFYYNGSVYYGNSTLNFVNS